MRDRVVFRIDGKQGYVAPLTVYQLCTVDLQYGNFSIVNTGEVIAGTGKVHLPAVCTKYRVALVRIGIDHSGEKAVICNCASVYIGIIQIKIGSSCPRIDRSCRVSV